MMRVLIAICAVMAGALSLAAVMPARAAAPLPDGLSAAARASSDIILVKKKGIPAWSVKKKKLKWHCPPGHWKKGWC
jgi:hypothetical protein